MNLQQTITLFWVNIYIDLANLCVPLSWDISQIKKALDFILAKAKSHGRIGDMLAFGYCNEISPKILRLLLAKGILPINTVPLNNNGKGSDDQTMFYTLTRLPFLQPTVKTAVIVAGDGDYTLAVAGLNSQGVETVLISTSDASLELERAANGCTYIELDKDGRLVNFEDESEEEEEKVELTDSVLLKRINDLIESRKGAFDRKSLTAELLKDETFKNLGEYNITERVAEFFQDGTIERYFSQVSGHKVYRIRLAQSMAELG